MRSGASGNTATFSLQMTKNLPTCGEGGLVVTDDDRVADRLVQLRQFGETIRPDRPRRYVSHRLGFNAKLSNVQAAYTSSQLERLDEYHAARRANVEAFLARLRPLDGLTCPSEPDGYEHAWHILRFVVDFDRVLPGLEPGAARNLLMRALRAEGMPVTRYQMMPLADQPHPAPAEPADPRLLAGHPARHRPQLHPSAAPTAAGRGTVAPELRRRRGEGLVAPEGPAGTRGRCGPLTGPEHQPTTAQPTTAQLAASARAVREHIVDMCAGPEGGHLGGSMSAVEILVALFFRTMDIDPADPEWKQRDIFVLSKGHAAMALYATLAERGFIPRAEVATFCRNSAADWPPTAMSPSPGSSSPPARSATGWRWPTAPPGRSARPAAPPRTPPPAPPPAPSSCSATVSSRRARCGRRRRWPAP